MATSRTACWRATACAELEREGYVSRTVRATSPPHVEYALTDLGRSLLEPIKHFLDWAQNTFPQVKQAREEFDQDEDPTDPREALTPR